MGRLKSGRIKTLRDFHEQTGGQIFCCIQTKLESNHELFRCDQTDWLPESEFRQQCQVCQAKITELLGVDKNGN